MLYAPPAALLIGAYLLGSIPFSWLVVRLLKGADIREHGSRNVGATNVARSFGKLPGIIALLLDIAKGYGAVAFAQWLTSRPEWPRSTVGFTFAPLHSTALWIALSGLVAVLAHMFPVWLGFHGGKGVATATGAFLALDPLVVAAGVIVFIIVLLLTRFVSLASMVSASSIPLFFRYLAHASIWTISMAAAIATAIVLKHHSNIARLAHGTERRIGQRKDEP